MFLCPVPTPRSHCCYFLELFVTNPVSATNKSQSCLTQISWTGSMHDTRNMYKILVVKLELTAGDTEKERREILEWISREEGGW